MENFLLSLFRLSVPFPADVLASKVALDGRTLSRRRVLDQIIAWRRSWDEVVRLSFDAVHEPTSATGKQRAREHFLVGYQLRSAADGEAYTFAGKGTVDFIIEDGEWRVAGTDFPGFPRFVA